MNKYSKRQMALHWGVAILFLAQFVFHDAIGAAFRAAMRGNEVAFNPLVAGHVFGGGLILLLTIYRLYNRKTDGVPPYPQQEAKTTKLASEIVHYGTYLLAVLLPISGAIAWFGLNRTAAEAHEIGKAVFLGLFALHMAGIAYHRVKNKTNVMKRMTPLG